MSNDTVNRTFIEPVRTVLRRAKKVWKVPIDLDGFEWSALLYGASGDRVRELQDEEETRLWQHVRADYAPIIAFYLLSGWRKSVPINLAKAKVDLTARTARVVVLKKGTRIETAKRLSGDQCAILAQEMAKSNRPEVFTYVVQEGKDKGLRRPITESGLRRAFQTACKAAGIDDFRIHDFRHTFGTQLLRETRNLKLVQKALDHSDIQSTLRYVHVLDDEVVEGMDRLGKYRRYPGDITNITSIKAKKV